MRTYKIAEFPAHAGAVNCVKIGRGTAGVLATGGEDKKVNLWRTGQTEVVVSLSGLQSSVECVVFGEKEDTIAAGGASGTVKMWDLESGKVSRSLAGHRSNCLSLAFTSSDNNLLVSGSLDCNVKVWDLRHKEAIHTLKGHSSGVLKVATSPDDKWIATGAEDGEIKMWDISAGKVLQECSGWRHGSRITGLDFNQVEMMLVSSGADRMVRLWDLELWEEVECLGPEATGLQGVAYAPDGRVLLTATADALKVWGLEPTMHHDTVPMGWRNLADLHMYYRDGQPRALGCCRSGSSVGVFMVDLRKVAPFCPPAEDTAADGSGCGGRQQQQQLSGVGSSSSRRAAPAAVQDYSAGVQLAPAQQQSSRRLDVGADWDAGTSQASAAPEVRPGPLITQLARQRTPKREAAAAGSSSAPASGALRALTSSTSATARRARPSPLEAAQQQQQQQCQGSGYFPDVEILVPAGPPPAMASQQQQQAVRQPPAPAGQQRPFGSVSSTSAAAAGSTGLLQHSNSSRGAFPGLDVAAASQQPDLHEVLSALSLQDTQQQHGLSRSSSKQQEAPGALGATLKAWLQEQGEEPAPKAASKAVSTSSSTSSSIPASRVPSRQNMGVLQQQQQQQQLPAAAASSSAATAPAAAPAVDPLLAMFAKAPNLRVDLARMLSGMQVAKGFVARGNMEHAYKSVLSTRDPALACMVLDAVSSRADAFELNSMEPLIKLLELLLGSDKEPQVATGLSVLGLVLRGPGQMVHNVCSAPQPTGVDLNFERRRSKCMLLKLALEGLGLKVGVLARSPGQLQRQAQMLAEDLKRVVSAAS